MCLHPISDYDVLDRPIEINKYQHELDNCDYHERNDLIVAKHGDLLVMQLNIRGLFGKMAYLKDLVNDISHGKKMDIILLCEMWQSKNSPPMSLPGYNYVSKYRKHKMGGGVGIFVSDRIRYTKIKINNSYECIEQVVINLVTKQNNTSITIASMYRAPDTNELKLVEEYKDILLELYKFSKSKRLILGMDHNLDFLKNSIHRKTQDFIETNLDNNLLPVITRPTRITKTSATLIDNIFVSQSLMPSSESRIAIDDISDHLPSVIKINDILQKNITIKMITSRKLNDKALHKIHTTLNNQNWSKVITENVDASFDRFHNIIQETLDLHVPITTRNLNPKKYRREPCISQSLLRSIKKQKQLYAKTLRLNVSDFEITKYRNYKKILDKLKRKAKHDFYFNKCVEYKSNVKKMWELINQVIGKTSDKTSVISYIKVNDLEILNEKAIANEFGKYFSNVGRTYAKNVKNSKQNIKFYNNKIDINPKSIFFTAVTKSEVKKIIDSLPNKNSSGYDNISNILLKKLCDPIVHPLTEILNLSIAKGIFPSKMKLAETTPLHKSKETYYTTNYRPILLLLTISKILEKIVYKRTYSFLN